MKLLTVGILCLGLDSTGNLTLAADSLVRSGNFLGSQGITESQKNLPPPDPYRGIPYHPYRKVGDKYICLQSLYDELIGKGQSPLKSWMVCISSAVTDYTIIQILPDGVLLERKDSRYNNFTGVINTWESTIFLQNFPDQSNLVDGKKVSFIALPSGNYQYTDTQGAVHTVARYDYGIPYDPWQLAAERARTNSLSGSTNPPAHIPQAPSVP